MAHSLSFIPYIRFYFGNELSPVSSDSRLSIYNFIARRSRLSSIMLGLMRPSSVVTLDSRADHVLCTMLGWTREFDRGSFGLVQKDRSNS
jgi:hypothetical protein